MIHFHVITLFPESLESYLASSIIARGISDKKIKVSTYQLRDFTPKELRKKWPDGNVTSYVDDRPYGGGPGMVLRAEPFLVAVEKILKKLKAKSYKLKVKVIFFSPSGKQFDTAYAKQSAKKYTDIIFLCGRYEGIDARVKTLLKAEEISVGPYVLTGGELPALIMIDSMARQVPGVLGKQESLEEERISSSEIYTRPEILVWPPSSKTSVGRSKKHLVPAVLLSGHQKKIEEWKQERNKE